MSTSNTAARLAFFGMEEPSPPAPSPTRAAVDSACAGHATAAPGSLSRGAPLSRSPEAWHVVHGRISIERAFEIRVTTSRGTLWIRPWCRNAVGAWWPARGAKGVRIEAGDVQAFARTVAAAATHLTTKAKS